MIQFETALSLILSHALPTASVGVALAESLGRVIAEPVRAMVDLPPFDSSAVDGYAIRAEDAPGCLRLAGSLSAGVAPSSRLEPGSAVRVMTGAMIPSGADAVVMQEEIELGSDSVILRMAVRPGQHIRKRGEEFKAQEVIQPKGAAVTPAVIGLVAGAGHARLDVFRPPRVAIVSTGDELVPPGEALQQGQVFRSNDIALRSAVRTLGLESSCSHCGDEPASFESTLLEVVANAEVVITTGGVSVGDRDIVKPVLEANGFERIFWGVAIKPGKPLYFAIKSGTLAFGLPGNPVSAMVTYFMFVRPALLAMLGFGPSEAASAIVLEDIKKKLGRLEFVRGRLCEEGVVPIASRESHMMGGLADADCLIHVPAETEILRKGGAARITPLRWATI